MQFNCKVAHIAGSVNLPADCLSRLELTVTEKIRHKILEGIQTTPIEVPKTSSDFAYDKANELEEQMLERK